jgi:hypothetical protein
VLRHAPALYSPDVETFAERTTGHPVDWPFKPVGLPIAFDDARGPTKILVDRSTLDDLGRWFEVRSDWLAKTRAEHARESGVFYVEPGGRVLPRVEPTRTDPLTFGDGWYGPEGEREPKFRWMRGRGELLVDRRVAGTTLRLTGTTPPQLAARPKMRITIGGTEVDRFIAPVGTFTRDIALPASDDDELPLTIESSAAVEIGGRTLAYALTDWGPPLTPTALRGAGARFTGDWDEPVGVPPDESRCMHGDASITIDSTPEGENRTLLVFAVSPLHEPSAPSTWRVTIDGHEIEDGPVFRMVRRIWPLRPGSHDVRFVAAPSFETADHAALCFWALRVVPTTELE